MKLTITTTKLPSSYTSPAAAYLLGRHWTSTVAIIDVCDYRHDHGCSGVANTCTCM